MMTNEQMLNKMDQAFKAITVGDLNEGVLVAEKFDRFIRSMQHRTVILNEARFMEMDSHIVDIDRIGFVGRIITEGVKDDESTVGSESHKKPTVKTNQLIAKELRAITGLKDRALRRNIERGNFENTLIDLFGEAAGRDMEEWAILAATDNVTGDISGFSDYSGDDAILGLTDGWVARADNVIYGDTGNVSKDNPEEIFDGLLAALPKQYLQDRSEWRFYCPWDIENAYRNQLRARGTDLGDRATTDAITLTYKGIPVIYVPMLDRAESPSDGWGDVVMLQHPDNMVWGVFYEVFIERDRDAKNRQTDFVLTFEGDADYEDEEAAAVCLLEYNETDDSR